MVDLAQHGEGGPVLRQETAERQEVSADYLAQLFGRLQSAGLVEGVKGPGGGYQLTRDAAKITSGDVLRAVEGQVAVVHCTLSDPDGGPPCSRADGCPTHLLWKQLSEAMTDVLDSVTLEDLADQARELALKEAS